jgi:phage head maturation protease
MSFAFTVTENGDQWRLNPDTDVVERTITRVGQLFDVSVVTFPPTRRRPWWRHEDLVAG